MRDLKKLRTNLPRPPAKEPVDRFDIDASIISEEWCNAHDIPVPNELVDGEYQLAQEVYRRVLYSDTWTQKDTHIQEYFKIVDDKRDYNLLITSDITFQCLDRHAKSVRRISHDSAQIKKSQETEKKLRLEYRDLEKVNIKLCKQIEDERKNLLVRRTKASPSPARPPRKTVTSSKSPALSKSNLKRSSTKPSAKKEYTRDTTPDTTRAGSPSLSTASTETPPEYLDEREGSPTLSSASTEIPLEYPQAERQEAPRKEVDQYSSPEEDEIELANLQLEELSNRSESIPNSPTESIDSNDLQFLQDQHNDLQYQSECERLETLSQKTKQKKKITFDLSQTTDKYTACEFCIQGFGKRTGHRGPHLTKRRSANSK